MSKLKGLFVQIAVNVRKFFTPIFVMFLALPLIVCAFALWIFKLTYGVVPILIVTHLGYKFFAFSNTFDKIPTPDEYKFLFGVVGLSATICSLTLRVASISEGNRKVVYAKLGGQLFYGTLLFILALALRHGCAWFSQGSELVVFLTKTPLWFLGQLTFYSALYFIGLGLIEIVGELAEEHQDPFYKLPDVIWKKIKKALTQLSDVLDKDKALIKG